MTEKVKPGNLISWWYRKRVLVLNISWIVGTMAILGAFEHNTLWFVSMYAFTVFVSPFYWMAYYPKVLKIWMMVPLISTTGLYLSWPLVHGWTLADGQAPSVFEIIFMLYPAFLGCLCWVYRGYSSES